jgi:hypothetical protein
MVARVDSRLRNRFHLLHVTTKTSGSVLQLAEAESGEKSNVGIRSKTLKVLSSEI